MYIELIGYLGSLLVVVSMLMTSVVKLRIINTVGSAIFTGYALVIHSYPTAAMNACLIVINMYNLFRLYKNARSYAILRLSPSDGFVRFFLDKHEADMKHFFPVVNKNLLYDYTCLVCHNNNPVGIFLAKTEADGTLNISIDYTIPAYRDCSVGKYLYTWLAHEQIPRLTIDKASAGHVAYLKKMGFSEQNGQWIKDMSIKGA